MKICFISPYLPDHFGGGEKYLLDCALTLSKSHQVFVAIPNKVECLSASIDDLKEKYSIFLDQDLSNITFIFSPIFGVSDFFARLAWTKKFDLIYYQTDGSIFPSLAKRNILHIQIPFTNHLSLLSRIKLLNWQVINTNSNFTKSVIEKKWQIKIDEVHHPMIAKPQTFNTKKEKVILNVGRFFTHLHSKRQDILIKAFIQLVKNQPQQMKDWKLVLVGAVEDQEYADKLKVMAKGYQVEFYHDLDRTKLVDWYKKTSIYWHATGYGVDEDLNPEKLEHFGITTVEAMSYGCVPVVVGKGGQIEVLGDQLHDLLWQSLDECQNITLSLIVDDKKMDRYAQLAIRQSKLFDQKIFASKLEKMLG